MAISPQAGIPSLADQRHQLLFVRLNAHERWQHGIFLICFVILVVTGFTLRLPDEWMRRIGASALTRDARSLLHRGAGLAMIGISIAHIYYLLFLRDGRAWLRDILPRLRDAKQMFQNIQYLLGLRSSPPRFGRFSYGQKAEYWALVVGTTLMSVTGLIMMFEYKWGQLTLEVAALIHNMEAVLACLAIIVWHFYEVHFRPGRFPSTLLWWHGLMTEDEMKDEHAEQYERLMESPRERERSVTIRDRI
jgi:formate dehydrogenase gamma subunit